MACMCLHGLCHWQNQDRQGMLWKRLRAALVALIVVISIECNGYSAACQEGRSPVFWQSLMTRGRSWL